MKIPELAVWGGFSSPPTPVDGHSETRSSFGLEEVFSECTQVESQFSSLTKWIRRKLSLAFLVGYKKAVLKRLRASFIVQLPSSSHKKKMLVERFHMVASSTVFLLTVGLLAELASGLVENSNDTKSSSGAYAVGRFPFLMPKVIPYKVSWYRGVPYGGHTRSSWTVAWRYQYGTNK